MRQAYIINNVWFIHEQLTIPNPPNKIISFHCYKYRIIKHSCKILLNETYFINNFKLNSKKFQMIDLNQQELSQKLENDDKAFLLDVRTQEEYDESHIPNSTLIDIKNPKSFLEGIENLNKDLNYYVYCHSGVRSVQACQIMKTFGITNVYNLLGGISEWSGPLAQD